MMWITIEATDFNNNTFDTLGEDIFNPMLAEYDGDPYRHENSSDAKESDTNVGSSDQSSTNDEYSWNTYASMFPYPSFWGWDPRLDYPTVTNFFRNRPTLEINRVARRIGSGIVTCLVRFGGYALYHIPVGDIS